MQVLNPRKQALMRPSSSTGSSASQQRGFAASLGLSTDADVARITNTGQKLSCEAGHAGFRPAPQALPQQNVVGPLLASELLPAWSTAFTVKVFAPLSVA